ncbi:hypothetical protein AGMMS50239_04120 [Bacteroidia bacterium]|nr:hypothetical protein AGMMS50239_04120 [Bacteroidia bacterium]
MGLFSNEDDKDFAKKCQKCGINLKKDFNYCPKCGTKRFVVLNQQDIFTIKNKVSEEEDFVTQETPKEISLKILPNKTKIQEKSEPDFSEITKQLNEIKNKLLQNNQLQNSIGDMLNNFKQSMTSCFENQRQNLQYQEFKSGLNELYKHLQQQIQNSVEDIKRNIPKNNEAVLQKNHQEILESIANNEHQNELNNKQYQEIQKLRGNFYSDLFLPIISDIIEITDDAKRISSVAEKKTDYLEKLPYFEKELNAHIEFSNGKLLNRGISIYKSQKQDTFDYTLHKIIEMEETQNKELHNKIAESIHSGYIWNISNSRKEIIRKEEVKVFEYKELLTKKNRNKIIWRQFTE